MFDEEIGKAITKTINLADVNEIVEDSTPIYDTDGEEKSEQEEINFLTGDEIIETMMEVIDFAKETEKEINFVLDDEIVEAMVEGLNFS